MSCKRTIETNGDIQILYFLNEDKITKVEPKTLVEFKYFPSKLELALISSVAYGENKSESKNFAELKQRELKEWIPIAIGTDEKSGYRGIGYFNLKKGQLVIAHKGTKWSLTYFKDLLNDLSVYMNSDNDQVKPAHNFARYVIDNFGFKSTSIVITGHSLGAWLAQISGFLIQYPKFKGENKYLNTPQIHIIAFDSPGAYGVISKYHEKTFERYDQKNSLQNFLNYFDCNLYLSEKNLINSVAEKHIGSVYKMHGVKTHKLREIIEFWKNEDPNKLSQVLHWPVGLKEYQQNTINFVPVDKKAVKVSYFSSEEIEFLEVVSTMAKYVKRENAEWESVVNESGKNLGIDYHLYETFCFDNRRLMIKINCDCDKCLDWNNLVHTFKFLRYNNHTVNTYFREIPAVHEVICRKFSDNYLKNLLMLEKTVTPDIGETEPLIEDVKRVPLSEPKLYKIESKSPIVTVSCIFHFFEENRNDIYFIDSKSLSILTKTFPEKVEYFFSSEIISILIIQVNCDLREIDYLLKRKFKITIFCIVSEAGDLSEHSCKYDFDEFYEQSPTLHYNDLTEESKSKILNKTIQFQGEPLASYKILIWKTLI